MTLLIIAALIAIFSSGCVSQSSIDAAIDRKIAANNIAFVQPMMDGQFNIIRADVARNRQAIYESSAQVDLHQNVLIAHYSQQKQQAVEALSSLAPEMTSPEPVTTPPVPVEPVKKETISASVSASDAAPRETAFAVSGL